MNNVYMGALSYADNIKIICPSIRGLNKMLMICNKFAQSNKIIFNIKKRCVYNLGCKYIRSEKAFLNSECLTWTDNIGHLGICIDCSNSDMVDCGIKEAMCIGYVNKLSSNYDLLQPHILINLYIKSNCCSFYDSMLWKYNSEGFYKICKSWNIVIRRSLRLPFNTHTRYTILCWKFLISVEYISGFFRNTFRLDKTCTLTITLIRNDHLDVHEQANVDTLIALNDVRAGNLVIDHFNNDYIENND